MRRLLRGLAGLREPAPARPRGLELPRRRPRPLVAGRGPDRAGSARTAAALRGRADHADSDPRGADPMTRPSDTLELEIPLVYMETSIPPGLTIADYARSRSRRLGRGHRLKELPRTVGGPARARPA